MNALSMLNQRSTKPRLRRSGGRRPIGLELLENRCLLSSLVSDSQRHAIFADPSPTSAVVSEAGSNYITGNTPAGGTTVHQDTTALIDIRSYGAKCDGVTDDKQAIDRAIAAIPPSGGTLLFPSGRICLTSGGHLLPSNTTIQAYGAVIMRKADPTLTQDTAASNRYHLFMALDGTTNLRVEGGIYDLNRSAFKDGLPLSAFFLRRHDGAEFRDITIQNGPEDALKLWNVANVTVLNSRFINFFGNIIEFDNIIADADGAPPGTPIPASENYLISNSYFRDVDDHLSGAGSACGITVGGKDSQTYKYFRIYNNFFVGCNRAIWFEIADTPGHNMEVQQAHVVGNTIVGSTTSTQTLDGIGFVGVKNSEIKDNVITNVASTSETVNDHSGIIISGSDTVQSEDITIINNVVQDLRQPPNNYTKYGILLRRGRRLTVVNNRVTGANKSQIYVGPLVFDSKIVHNYTG